MQRLFVGATILSTVVVGAEIQCLAGARIKGPGLAGSIMAFDRFIAYRIGSTQSQLCATNRSVAFSELISVWALNYGVFERQDSGSSRGCGTSYSRLFAGGMDPTHYSTCTPAKFQKYPHDCAIGDWSGKFGPMLIPASRGLDAQILAHAQAQGQSPPLPQSYEMHGQRHAAEFSEIRVLEDITPISSCYLPGMEVRIYCPDGEIAACGQFDSVAQGARPSEMIQTSLEYMLRDPSLTGATDKFGSGRNHDAGLRDWASKMWSDTQKKTSQLWNRAVSISSELFD